MITTTTTREPVYQVDVVAVTGLDAIAIKRSFKAARGVAPVWPADPYAVAASLLYDGETVAGINMYDPRRAGEPSATERLAAKLVAERERRQRENDDRLERGWREAANIAAVGRAADRDAVRDSIAAANKVEGEIAAGLGERYVEVLPRLELRG